LRLNKTPLLFSLVVLLSLVVLRVDALIVNRRSMIRAIEMPFSINFFHGEKLSHCEDSLETQIFGLKTHAKNFLLYRSATLVFARASMRLIRCMALAAGKRLRVRYSRAT